MAALEQFPAAGALLRVKNPLVAGGEWVTLRAPTDQGYATLCLALMTSKSRGEQLAACRKAYRELAVDWLDLPAEEAEFLLGRVAQLNTMAAGFEDELFVIEGYAVGRLRVRFAFRVPDCESLAAYKAGGMTLWDGCILFDGCIVAAVGYAGAVPVYHKGQAAVQLCASLFNLAPEGEKAEVV